MFEKKAGEGEPQRVADASKGVEDTSTTPLDFKTTKAQLLLALQSKIDSKSAEDRLSTTMQEQLKNKLTAILDLLDRIPRTATINLIDGTGELTQTTADKLIKRLIDEQDDLIYCLNCIKEVNVVSPDHIMIEKEMAQILQTISQQGGNAVLRIFGIGVDIFSAMDSKEEQIKEIRKMIYKKVIDPEFKRVFREIVRIANIITEATRKQ